MTEAASLTAIGLAGAGLLVCFFGYRMFRLIITATGFAIGFCAAAGLLHLTLPPVVLVIVAIACGAISALLVRTIYMAGVFLAGGTSACAITWALSFTAGTDPALLTIIAAFIIGGICATLLHPYAVILTTSVCGATFITLAAVAGARVQLLSITGPYATLPALITWLALIIIGIFVQYSALHQHYSV